MKKAVALPILLLANIIILAHVIIPHHHHNGLVVSICNFLSVDEILEHDHDPYTHHHNHNSAHHDHDGELGEDCLLNDLYLRISQDREPDISSVDPDLSHYPNFSPIFATVSTYEIEIRDYGNLPFRQKPYVNSYHSYYITHSLGLRAPPFC